MTLEPQATDAYGVDVMAKSSGEKKSAVELTPSTSSPQFRRLNECSGNKVFLKLCPNLLCSHLAVALLVVEPQKSAQR